jgi:dTDP-4-dehydrorhamnose 3,5-epimerase
MKGVVVEDLTINVDDRGNLIELFRADSNPIISLMAMCYVSTTMPGIARGPHEHRKQTDYFYFAGPGTFDIYLWDNRKDSATYGIREIVQAGTGMPKSVRIPPGVVHAYKNVGSVPGIVINFPDRLYKGSDKKFPVDEIRYENDSNSPFQVD